MNKALQNLKNSKPRIEGYEKAVAAIKDPEMRELVDEIWVLTASRGLYYLKASRYDKNLKFSALMSSLSVQDVTWTLLCDIVHTDPELGIYCSWLLYRLLNEGRYCCEYKTKLLYLKEMFHIDAFRGQCRHMLSKFCYDDIRYICILKDHTSRKYYLIRTDNTALWGILSEFCDRDKNSYSSGTSPSARDWFYAHIHEIFEEDEFSLNTISSFSYQTFTHQVEKCKMSPKSVELLRMLQRFYAFLIEHPSGEGRNIFLEHDDMDITVLKRDDFAQRIVDGFKYIYYNPFADVPEEDKWILHINGHQRGSTKSKGSSTRTFDFTRIDSLYYRRLVKEYFWNETSNNFNTNYEQFIALVPLINKLSELKRKSGVSEKLITIDETHFIRLWMKNSDASLNTRNSKISGLKRFLEVLEDKGAIETELLSLNYLGELAKPHPKDAKAIPEEHIEAINNVMLSHSDESPERSYCYVIFHILIQTEFRLSQACHLETGCIVPTMNRNQFIITESKTSHGQKYQPIITDFTKELIDDAEYISAPIREKCTTAENEKYLFLYCTTENQYVPIAGRYFRDYLAHCCDEAGIPRYTPSNIRDFHMTKAQEMILKKGYSNASLRILSGHRHVDVTTNHYIEEDLTRIFEAMYGVIIGDIEIKGQIVDKIPDEINDKRHTVEGGCGKCLNKTCIVDSLISCLICSDFVTAKEFVGEFKKLAEYLDSCIEKVSLPHDKEDLVNKKRLVVAYIIKMETMIAEAAQNGDR